MKSLSAGNGSAGTAWNLDGDLSIAELAADAEVRRRYPGLADAAAGAISPFAGQDATVRGNLAQRSRCWYYRQRDFPCGKKGGETCYARDGESKYHALFSGSLCVSPLVSSLAIALAALDARVVVRRGRQNATFTLDELYRDAWEIPEAHHSLRPQDLILRVEVPAADGRSRSAYLQVAERGDFDRALVSCAVAADVEHGVLRGPRIVLGAVAPVPWQVEEANAYLDGRTVTTETTGRVSDLLLREARPFGDNTYKLHIARALVRRTLAKLVE